MLYDVISQSSVEYIIYMSFHSFRVECYSTASEEEHLHPVSFCMAVLYILVLNGNLNQTSGIIFLILYSGDV